MSGELCVGFRLLCPMDKCCFQELHYDTQVKWLSGAVIGLVV
jgi:hypothetical protein